MLIALTLQLACTSGTPSDSSAETGTPPDSPPPEGREDLTDPALWVPLEAAEDPFADHRPDQVECDPDQGISVETGLLEVDTTFCAYVTAAQPSLAEVVAGDTLQVLVYHGSLNSSVEGEAHVALMLGEVLVWEQHIAIPGGSDVYSTELPAEVDAPTGTQAVFHLHNHGNNSWNLGHYRRDR